MGALANIDWLAAYGAFHVTCAIGVLILFLHAHLSPPTDSEE